MGHPGTHESNQRSDVALLLIDVVNDLEWEGAEGVIEPALRMADHIAALKIRAAAAGIPILYVNDNFGRWKSDFKAQVEHCLRDGVRGAPLVRRLLPTPEDYFVLKPRHSGFYSTTLEILLRALGSKTLILCGIAADNCVLFTANDAYMRGFQILVPRDCVVANREEEKRRALEQMAKVLKADTRDSESLSLSSLGRSP